MKKTNTLIGIIVALTLVLVVLVAVALMPGNQPEPTEPSKTLGTDPTTQKPSQPTAPTDAPTEPTEPLPHKVSTATVSSVGDILMHSSVYNSGYDSNTGTYGLDPIFQYFTDYVMGADMSLCNLETTLAGPDRVYYDSDGNRKVGYSGYPNFNCPDAIVDAMKNAGFDNILTANNHTYDTGHAGLLRTQEILQDRGLPYMGTKADPEDANYYVAELNGIRVGMMCYTYATGSYDGQISLNGILLTKEDSPLVNAFDYNKLPEFYAEMEENMADMEAAGAEVVMMFIHWGDEYQLKANSKQKAIAQKLCDLGVDVIVGGHPHVVEPVELLTSTEDESQKTVCLYSMGNAVSNQRHGLINACPTAHTEDGVMFSVTFAKYSDGTVIVESADILPIWVDMRRDSRGVRQYYILPLDKQVEDWKTQFDLTDTTLQKALDSYDRTMAIVGTGLEEANAYYEANQAAVEAELGIE